jgi:uncharacterized protein YciI
MAKRQSSARAVTNSRDFRVNRAGADAAKRVVYRVARDAHDVAMEWIYFLHAPRENFAQTMTDAEKQTFGAHFQYLQRLFSEGTLILAGPTRGKVNTGICIFTAPDQAAAEKIMNDDPVVSSGIARGELREMNVAFKR